jgi:hypothetical protein
VSALERRVKYVTACWVRACAMARRLRRSTMWPLNQPAVATGLAVWLFEALSVRLVKFGADGTPSPLPEDNRRWQLFLGFLLFGDLSLL